MQTNLPFAASLHLCNIPRLSLFWAWTTFIICSANSSMSFFNWVTWVSICSSTSLVSCSISTRFEFNSAHSACNLRTFLLASLTASVRCTFLSSWTSSKALQGCPSWERILQSRQMGISHSVQKNRSSSFLCRLHKAPNPGGSGLVGSSNVSLLLKKKKKHYCTLYITCTL